MFGHQTTKDSLDFSRYPKFGKFISFSIPWRDIHLVLRENGLLYARPLNCMQRWTYAWEVSTFWSDISNKCPLVHLRIRVRGVKGWDVVPEGLIRRSGYRRIVGHRSRSSGKGVGQERTTVNGVCRLGQWVRICNPQLGEWSRSTICVRPSQPRTGFPASCRGGTTLNSRRRF